MSRRLALVFDTGVLLSLLNKGDGDHQRCCSLVNSADSTKEDLVIPDPVLTELSYWSRRRMGFSAWKGFCEDVLAGAYNMHHLSENGLLRALEIDEQYADLNLGFVDASVVATCEELNETKVATLDRRDFTAIRPAHCESLTILPE